MEKGLAETYSGPTFDKNGFTYIPWNEAAKVANRVFGIDGYHVSVLRVEQLGPGYMAHVKVSVFPSDAAAFSREGIGYNELTGDSGRAHDTAVKGAASDALNRAFKLFGEAFGLALYDKAERGDAFSNSKASSQSANRPNTQTDTARPSGANNNGLAGLLSREPQPASKDGNIGNVSPAQATHARKKGWTDDMLVRLTRDEVKPIMDGVFGKGPVVNPPTVNATAAKPKAAKVEELNLSDDADLPF